MADASLPFSLIIRNQIMIGSIIEIVIGWLVTYKAPKMLKAKGTQATIIKLIGWLLIIAGIISFVRAILGMVGV